MRKTNNAVVKFEQSTQVVDSTLWWLVYSMET